MERGDAGPAATVDEYAVGRPEVLDRRPNLGADHAGVPARDEWIVEMDVAAVRAPDDSVTIETPLATASGMYLQHRDGHGFDREQSTPELPVNSHQRGGHHHPSRSPVEIALRH